MIRSSCCQGDTAMLYLASQSPRRRELLDQIGVPHQVIPQDIDESVLPTESPEQYVNRMALEKAQAGLKSLSEQADHCVLGADTIVVFDGQILGKPVNETMGFEMLARLSGRKHQVISAIALIDSINICQDISKTEVSFRELSPELIKRYWQTQEPRDKAGGYGIQGMGAVFVEELVGSYSGVVGLPIEILYPMLNTFKVPYWQ